MNLKRLADEVQNQIGVDLLATVDGTEPLMDYELEFSRELSIDRLEQAMKKFEGRDLSASDDADMALAVHAALPLTPREATDRNVWWWLSLRRFPVIVRRRWASADDGGTPTIARERMLGQVNRNAVARLWWGAEMTRATSDATKYTRLMFRNQDLFEAIIGRSLGRNPAALEVILDELSGIPGKDARETVRDLRFLLSTLVLEAMTPDALRTEISHLKNGRSPKKTK
jgi:hypothetical protein